MSIHFKSIQRHFLCGIAYNLAIVPVLRNAIDIGIGTTFHVIKILPVQYCVGFKEACFVSSMQKQALYFHKNSTKKKKKKKKSSSNIDHY